MKKCANSSNCPWGSVSTPGCCAYRIDTKDFDCPMIWENYEIIIDKISKEPGIEIA